MCSAKRSGKHTYTLVDFIAVVSLGDFRLNSVRLLLLQLNSIPIPVLFRSPNINLLHSSNNT